MHDISHSENQVEIKLYIAIDDYPKIKKWNYDWNG